MINRQKYLDKLISRKENGLIKIITGVRRSGKSYLLNNIFYDYLLSIGVKKDHIIQLAFDDIENEKYLDSLELSRYVKSKIIDKNIYYLLLDEIQLVDKFVAVLNGLLRINNIDIYVTGSNSKFLSSDIATEFRGRGAEVRIYSLSYREFYDAYEDEKINAWKDYWTYGGMPLVVLEKNQELKRKYLQTLFDNVYINDIIERNNIKKDKEVLEELLNIISSSIGSLTNPLKLSKTYQSKKNLTIKSETISHYLECFIDAFLIDKVYKYDIKGKNYIGTPLKYYFSDVGLRNSRLNFRQQEENHIMENIIFNELKIRDFEVDIGIVIYNYKNEKGISSRKEFEVDFIANKGSKRYYIQVALSIDDEEKRKQEINSLTRINDSFKKIVVIKDNIIPWHDENGILYIGIEQFLLDNNSMDL